MAGVALTRIPEISKLGAKGWNRRNLINPRVEYGKSRCVSRGCPSLTVAEWLPFDKTAPGLTLRTKQGTSFMQGMHKDRVDTRRRGPYNVILSQLDRQRR